MGTTTTAILTAVAAAMSAAGAIAQGRAVRKQAGFQAAVQEQQSQLQHLQAERERRLTAAQEAQLRRRQARARASARARFAAGGRDIAAGSALLLQEDAAAQDEFEALLNRSIGLERAHALENQAGLSRLDAARLRMQGSAASRQSFFTAGTSLLRGGASVSRLYP